MMVIFCSLGAAVQGMDESVISGGQSSIGKSRHIGHKELKLLQPMCFTPTSSSCPRVTPEIGM